MRIHKRIIAGLKRELGRERERNRESVRGTEKLSSWRCCFYANLKVFAMCQAALPTCSVCHNLQLLPLHGAPATCCLLTVCRDRGGGGSSRAMAWHLHVPCCCPSTMSLHNLWLLCLLQLPFSSHMPHAACQVASYHVWRLLRLPQCVAGLANQLYFHFDWYPQPEREL